MWLIWEARKILDTPAPRVYSWNSQASSHPVEAEFIIMDKSEDVPLSQICARWNYLRSSKCFLLWHVSRRDGWVLHSRIMAACTMWETCNHRQATITSRMARPPKIRSLLLAQLQAGIGRMLADQFWISREGHVGWSSYHLHAAADNIVGASLAQYLQDVGTWETEAIQSLKPPKQIALFCGTRLYQPDTEKRLTDPGTIGWDWRRKNRVQSLLAVRMISRLGDQLWLSSL